MEFDDPDPELADRARRFVTEEVLPVERDRAGGDAVDEAVLDELRDRAREYDVYAPQAPAAYGGMDLDLRTALPVFEAAGRSVLGPPALGVDPPDQGNAHLLEMIGTDRQKERWLRPLVAGELESAFAVSEPPPGAGSDPSKLRTVAEADGNEWVVDGHKWWTTQGTDADVLFVVARTGDAPEDGATIFVVPADAEGVRVREMDGVGQHGLAGHAEIRLDGVRVPDTAVLGEPGKGLKHAAERKLASALGRSMRRAGMAERALSVAATYVSEREVGGEPLAAKGAMRLELADAEAQLHAVRTLIRDAAERFVDGERRLPVAIARTVTSTAVAGIVGTAVQACGGHGVARDLPLSAFYERVRPTNDRLANVGASERIAESILADRVDERELDPMIRFRDGRPPE